ncbi:MAG: alpha/beta hydrolase [Spirochaetaceae bacterium]|nr:alpha/beta hydrolase [Spirochaetaceae bacterium]
MKCIKKLLVVLLMFSACAALFAREKFNVYIWEGVENLEQTHIYMEVSIPDNPNGTTVIICPGGSYHHLGVLFEGYCSQDWFNSHNVTTCILRYRVSQRGFHYPAMMQDVQRALELVRENPERYKAKEGRIGLIGYSAGGHLVAWAGAFASRTNELEKIGLNVNVSLRPDFVISVYPVVSMQEDIAHAKSVKNLLGKNPTQEMRDLFSLEKQVPFDMPPTYLLACRDDPVVPYENSERLYQALVDSSVPCEFKTYETGGHGFGMRDTPFMKQYHWNDDLWKWLVSEGFVPSAQNESIATASH